MEPEVVRFDPWLALSGGSDGLNSYRALAVQLPGLLAGEGRAFIELGFGQAAATRLFETGGLEAVDCRSDLAGIPRCLSSASKKELEIPLRPTRLTSTEHAASTSGGEQNTPSNGTPAYMSCGCPRSRTGNPGGGDPGQRAM